MLNGLQIETFKEKKVKRVSGGKGKREEKSCFCIWASGDLESQ